MTLLPDNMLVLQKKKRSNSNSTSLQPISLVTPTKKKKDHKTFPNRSNPPRIAIENSQFDPANRDSIPTLFLDRHARCSQRTPVETLAPKQEMYKIKEKKRITIAETWRQSPPRSKRCLARDPACAPDLAIRSLRMRGGRVLSDETRCGQTDVWFREDCSRNVFHRRKNEYPVGTYLGSSRNPARI